MTTTTKPLKEVETSGECLALTFNSERKNLIIEKIIVLLANLYTFGFSKPLVTQQEWSTTLTLMLTNIALEIEIGWRDFDVFVLVVRLENGNLPSGYYVSEGRPCRYHLQKVISDRKWIVDRQALANISPGKKGQRQDIKRSEEGMLNRFDAYRKVLDDCVEKLVKEGDTIFTD
jgi:hypothetical protein